MSKEKQDKEIAKKSIPSYGQSELKKIQDSKLKEKVQNNQKTTQTTSEGRPNKGGGPGSED